MTTTTVHGEQIKTVWLFFLLLPESNKSAYSALCSRVFELIQIHLMFNYYRIIWIKRCSLWLLKIRNMRTKEVMKLCGERHRVVSPTWRFWSAPLMSGVTLRLSHSWATNRTLQETHSLNTAVIILIGCEVRASWRFDSDLENLQAAKRGWKSSDAFNVIVFVEQDVRM